VAVTKAQRRAQEIAIVREYAPDRTSMLDALMAVLRHAERPMDAEHPAPESVRRDDDARKRAG
jgi:hypothetical protein